MSKFHIDKVLLSSLETFSRLLIYCYYYLQAFLSLSYQVNNTKVNEIVTEVLKHIPCGKNKSEKKYMKRLKQRLKKSLQV